MQQIEPELEKVQRWLELLVPVEWSIPDDFLTWNHYERVLGRIWMDSSPGLPLMYSHATNAQVFGWDGVTIDPEKKRFIWDLLQQRFEDYSCDPIRVFVKQELHKKMKADLGRWRLISSVSLLDQIMDHMLFDDFNDAVMALDGFVQAAWSPSRGGWMRLRRRLGEGPYLAIDKSVWDWTMPGWVSRVELELRRATCANMNSRWLSLAEARYNSLYSEAVFQLSSGLRFKQNGDGLQKSGAVNTIVMNSIGQIAFHIAAALELGLSPGANVPYALGDDTIQKYDGDVEQYAVALAKFGCVVKEAKVCENIEFAGREIGQQYCHPLYSVKHYYNLLYSSEQHRAEMCRSYLYEYAHVRDGRRDAIRELARISGVTGLTDRVLTAWMNGWEAVVEP